MYDEVLQAVIDMAEAAAGTAIVTGSLPPDNGIAMTGQASSAPIFLDIGSNERMSILCNGKNRDQQTVIRQLDAIHRAQRLYFDSGHWNEAVLNALSCDFSWNRSAREYMNLYKKVLGE